MNFNYMENAELDNIKERFVQIILEHPQKWWAAKVGVSQGLISSSWKAGNLPRIETLIKILHIKGISPNWFFYNIKPKHIKDIDGFSSDLNIQHNREVHRKMLEAENELLELRGRVKHLENKLKMQNLSQLASISVGEKGNERDLFDSHGLPLVTFMRLLNDILFKSFEITVTQMDDEKFSKMLDWISSNFDSGKFKAIAALKSLDSEVSTK